MEWISLKDGLFSSSYRAEILWFDDEYLLEDGRCCVGEITNFNPEKELSWYLK